MLTVQNSISKALYPQLFSFFFSIFIINYSPLIARIIKRGSGKRAAAGPRSLSPCVRPRVRA